MLYHGRVLYCTILRATSGNVFGPSTGTLVEKKGEACRQFRTVHKAISSAPHPEMPAEIIRAHRRKAANQVWAVCI